MKHCDDCGASSPDTAVTCAECGSLFPDQIGIDLRGPSKVSDFDDLALTSFAPSPSPSPESKAVSVCRVCGAKGLATQRRCVVCGSDQVAIQLASSARQIGRRKFLSAWDRRPRVGVLDAGVPDISPPYAYTFFSIGVFKLLLETWLAASLVMGDIGPEGLQYATYLWRYPLAGVLTLDAFLAAYGGYALIGAKRYGAALLSVSFALDALLVIWLVICIHFGYLVLWPESGPYLFLIFVCLACMVDTGRRALKGD